METQIINSQQEIANLQEQIKKDVIYGKVLGVIEENLNISVSSLNENISTFQNDEVMLQLCADLSNQQNAVRCRLAECNRNISKAQERIMKIGMM